jgi:hypothetical protein
MNASGGEENVLLTTDHLPSHVHDYTITYLPNWPAWQSGGGGVESIDWGGYDSNDNMYTAYTGYQSPYHNNMPPFYVLVYIIKTDDYNFDY